MKLTKRMKNSIIQAMVANIFFFLILLGALLGFLYPRISDIEDQKTELVMVYEKLQKISISGLSFADFKGAIRANPEFSKDSYTSNLLKNITGEFYSENFTNTGSQQYDIFLEELKTEVAIEKTSDEYIQKDQTLSTVLPIYDEKNIFSDEGLSDFYFTNYVENILYSFNIASKGEIGIGKLEKQGGEEDTGAQSDNFQEDIYKIPLLLSIVGQKKDVVDFIHYFENVGGIHITEQGFEIYRDTFISKQIEGAEFERNYNIYKNQISDISSFVLPKYPDSSSLETTGLIEAMKGKQGREKMEIEVELSFYVAGVPSYKMEKYIVDFLTLYDVTSSNISEDAKKYTTQAYKFSSGEELLAIQKLQSLVTLMQSLNEDIIVIRKSIAKRENIEKNYEQVVKYHDQISKIQESYNKQLDNLKQ